MNCLVVVPARGGSKRIKNKNIALLKGRPLLSYTIDCVRQAGLILNTFVSTDDPGIAEIAKNDGAQVIVRPQELATDTASTESVLLHALQSCSSRGEVAYEWVMCLPPTSPLRAASTVAQFVSRLDSVPADVDCVMSTTENRGDFWQYDSDGQFRRLFPDAPRRQQDRNPLYEENSAIYVTRVSALNETGSILGKKVLGIPISQIEALDINTVFDLNLAEDLLSRAAIS